MEKQHQKWVNVSFLALAGLAGYIVYLFSLKLVGAYDLEARIRNIDVWVLLASIGIGGLLFLVLYKNSKINQFLTEVVSELLRVTWPTQKETASATFIVIIMVLISGLILGLLDYVWTRLLQLVL